jgi:hypothetical protein
MRLTGICKNYPAQISLSISRGQNMNSAAAEIDVHDQLIREAFIEPIRTVVVVDDEYPTLDSLTAKEIKAETGAWGGQVTAVENVRGLLNFARARAKPWLVDVHDGREMQAEYSVASHLDHSDLLVLDYHLDGNGGSGDKAINILRRLAKSDHFNLVIVHTNGSDGVIDGVITEIKLSLTFADPKYSLKADEKTSIEAGLDEWDDAIPGTLDSLKEECSPDDYLSIRANEPCDFQKMLNSPGFGQRVFERWKDRPNKENLRVPKNLLRWLVADKQNQWSQQLSKTDFGKVLAGKDGEVNWIRTEKLFITVLPKRCPPDQFENKLAEAIKVSYPSPHRLLLTKMRANIAQYGLAAEAEILGNRQVQAELLNDFLTSESSDPQAVIRSSINRHWEALGDNLIGGLNTYAQQLRDHFAQLGVAQVFEKCGLSSTGVNTAASLKHFNYFISTKPIDRAHLTTGHIFQVEQSGEDKESELWICMSPACDMVPGQKSQPGLTDCIRFMAVRLYKVTDDQSLPNATNNSFLFLEKDGEVETYSMYHAGDVALNPTWEQKYVRNSGRFGENNSIELGSIREADGNLATQWERAVVTFQLRSEYALNLLQRVGALLSRPGLGMNFKKLSKETHG